MEPELVRSADGTEIAVWRSGTGPPLVLVHGTSADHTRWAPAMPAFEERFTVLAVDRRGRGASEDGDGYAIEREFEDVTAVVDWAGQEVDLLGHSYGGICALEGALRTTAVRRLILYEPPLGFVQPSADVIDELAVRLDAGDRDGLLSVFFERVAGVPPDQIELMRSLPAWEARLAAAATVPREERANREYEWEPERFRGLDVPTLYLLGGASPEAFRAAAEAVAGVLPNARLVEMPGQSHVAIDTGTDLFTREVLSFLESA